MKAASADYHRDVYPHNDKTKSAYYAFPIKQQTMHIEIWLDMLEVAGFKVTSRRTGRAIGVLVRQGSPRTGKERHAELRHGFPMGVDSSDSFYCS
jgi:multiple sugar transport system substrate-binding protein